MRVLMLPLLGALSNIPSESCWVNARWLWRAGRRMYRQFYVYVALPKEVASLCEADLTDEERAYVEIVVEEHVPFTFHVQESMFDPIIVERFGRYCGRDWVDVIWTARTGIGQSLQYAMRDWRGAGGMPRVVLWDPGVDQDTFAQKEQADALRLAKAYSFASCPTQYLTQREFDIAVEWGRRFLSPAMVKEIQRLGKVIQPALKSVPPNPTTNPSRHVLFFGARLNQTKRIDWIVDFYTKVYALGYDVDVLITSPSKVKPAVLGHMRDKGLSGGGGRLVEVIGKCGREQFAKVMNRATICTIASTYEGFPYGFLQIAASGMLTLFPDKPWAHGTVPAGSPWIYTSEAEALTWVKQAMAGQWKRMVCQQLEVIRHAHGDASKEDYDEARWRFYMDPQFQNGWRKQFAESNVFLQMLRTLSAERETFTLAEACSYIVEKSDMVTERHWDAPPARFWPRAWVHRVLTEVIGRIDLCDGTHPRYGRKETGHGEEGITASQG